MTRADRKQMSVTPGYAERFVAVRGSLPGRGLGWLDALRAEAMERYGEVGFPTPRVEAWKFTNLRPLTRQVFDAAPAHADGVAAADLARLAPEGLAAYRLVFVNGHFRADLSDKGGLPEGVRLTSLAEALDDDPELVEFGLAGDGLADADGPLALNTAFMADGAVLALARGVALERPVHLVFVGAPANGPAAAHLRNLVLAGAGASATVIETYAGADGGAYWTNAVTEVIAEPDAAVRHLKAQGEHPEAFHLAKTRVRLAKGAAYDSFAAALGARLARNEIAALLDGPGADCRLRGIYMGRGRQHLDTTTVIDHAKPECYSNEHYKGVLDEAAHGVFQGKIVVREDAQKTDAHQLNKSLLLSEGAEIDTKPELEINADDVKCSHGAAAGELDADSLFYLRSRGLSPETAQRILVEAFVGEVVDAVEPEPFRAQLREVVAAWLPGGA